jgi:hypothetical protein
MNRFLKTMIISTLLVIAMPMAKLSAQVSVWDGTHEEWTHGTGTEDDPFLIENAQQLAYLAYRVNNGLDSGGGHVSNHNYHYKLMVDVDLNGSGDFQWTPIGYYNSDTDYQRFGGQLDGNNHTVSGMYINSSANEVGFFGNTEGATIKKISIRGSSITTTGGHAGGIVGNAFSTKIIACDNTCDVSSCGPFLNNYNPGISGGIVGMVWETVITNCYNTGSVSASSTTYSCIAGGIVGCVSSIGIVTISNCYNVGSVSASSTTHSSDSGGIVGFIDETTIINTCFNAGNIYSSSNWNSSGGIVGISFGTNTVTNSYNTSIVSPSNNSGGIIGYDRNGCNVTNCYYLNNCGGNNTNGGAPMSDDAMKTEEFVYILNNGTCSWIFDNTNINNGYPILTMISYSAGTYNATGITATSAILKGFVTIDNTNVISKGFEYKKTGDLNYTSINITNNSDYFSYNLTGLATNTTYEYRTFLNVADCDVTSYGDTKTFTLSLLNNDTICIYDADMLRWVSEQCNSGSTFEGYCIKLMNDITLPLNVPNNMTSIGAYPNYPFKGTFDGNGKLITNLYIDQPNTPYQGFFGYTLNANLYNVGLVNITASGRNYTGGMVAYAKNTHMRECYVNGGTLHALSYCGGLVGYQEQGTNSIISGCYNTCEVTGTNYVGGLIGFSNYSTVRNSYVAGRVAAQGEPVGAIIGGANEVLMYYCYFSTELTGQTEAIGWNNIGKAGGEGLTNEQMRDPQFVNTLNQGLVTPVWMADYTTHINNGFPIIKWQRPGTGVEEHDAAKNPISLYPNPTNGFITIQSDDSNVSLKHVEVYDVTGRKVMSENLSGQSQRFSIEKLPAGFYNVRIQTDNRCNTNLKLVVQ